MKQKINIKRQLYIALCDEIDSILIESGIREICVKCSIKKPFRLWHRKNKVYGCCSGCKHLGRKGCKTKSLMCKLWLCDETLKSKLKKYPTLYDRFYNIKTLAHYYGWGYSFFSTRRGIEDYQELKE